MRPRKLDRRFKKLTLVGTMGTKAWDRWTAARFAGRVPTQTMASRFRREATVLNAREEVAR
jgi:hypothetical protein